MWLRSESTAFLKRMMICLCGHITRTATRACALSLRRRPRVAFSGRHSRVIYQAGLSYCRHDADRQGRGIPQSSTDQVDAVGVRKGMESHKDGKRRWTGDYYPFSPGALTGVVFGALMSHTDQQTVKSWIKVPVKNRYLPSDPKWARVTNWTITKST